MPVNNWVTDDYVEWACANEAEDHNTYWWADGLLDNNDEMYVHYDAGQTPTTVYPPNPPKVRPPSGTPCTRPPSAPSVNPPNAPRIRRPKAPALPY